MNTYRLLILRERERERVILKSICYPNLTNIIADGKDGSYSIIYNSRSRIIVENNNNNNNSLFWVVRQSYGTWGGCALNVDYMSEGNNGINKTSINIGNAHALYPISLYPMFCPSINYYIIRNE